MATVVFYEKPGCAGNARQKGLLAASGHVLEVRDLLAFPWTPDTLRPFFGDQPVAAWFNPLAPAVRDGRLDPSRFDEAAALAALIAEPILIRRPLLEVGAVRRCGFDPAVIDAWIGLGGAAPGDIERCPRPADSPPCPTAQDRPDGSVRRRAGA